MKNTNYMYAFTGTEMGEKRVVRMAPAPGGEAAPKGPDVKAAPKPLSEADRKAFDAMVEADKVQSEKNAAALKANLKTPAKPAEKDPLPNLVQNPAGPSMVLKLGGNGPTVKPGGNNLANIGNTGGGTKAEGGPESTERPDITRSVVGAAAGRVEDKNKQWTEQSRIIIYPITDENTGLRFNVIQGKAVCIDTLAKQQAAAKRMSPSASAK
jgi:hypothetical protein